MARFVLNSNKQPNGDNEVHNRTLGCDYMPRPENQIDLGEHLSCHGAVNYAKSLYGKSRINGCRYCCPSCHTT